MNIVNDGDVVLLQMLQHIGVNRLGFGFCFGQFDGIAVRIAGNGRCMVIVGGLYGVLGKNQIGKFGRFAVGRRVVCEKRSHLFVQRPND